MFGKLFKIRDNMMSGKFNFLAVVKALKSKVTTSLMKIEATVKTTMTPTMLTENKITIQITKLLPNNVHFADEPRLLWQMKASELPFTTITMSMTNFHLAYKNSAMKRHKKRIHKQKETSS